MQTVPDAYGLAAAQSHQPTIYVLYLPAFGVYYSTDRVLGLDAAVPIIMDRPALATSQTNYLSASASLGSISMRLLDLDERVTELRQGGQVRGTEHRVYFGYEGLRWDADPDISEYTEVLRGRVTRFEREGSGTVWALEAGDNFEPIDREIFSPEALAAEPYTEAEKSWDGGSLVLWASDPDTEIYDRVTLTGTADEIGLKMLLSDGSLDGSQSGYNVWPAWAGLGLTTDEVDVDWWEDEGAKVVDVPMQFILTDAENVKDFIEVEICRALGGYPLLSNTGQLRIHYPVAPPPGAAVVTLTDDHVIGTPPWADSSELYMSHVQYELDHDGSTFQTKLPRRASWEYLTAQTSEVRLHSIQSRGLRTELGGISIADAITDMLLRRHAVPPPRIRMAVFFSQHRIEAGELVACTSGRLPNVDGLGEGATRYLEVLSRRPTADKVELDVIDLTAYSTAARTAVIAPNGQPDYGSASAEEREFAYIADDSTGTFANGDDAYIFG